MGFVEGEEEQHDQEFHVNARAFLDFLVSQGVIPREKVPSLMETASLTGERIDTTILDFQLVSEGLLLKKLGEFTRSRTCSASELSLAGTELAGLISPRVAKRFGVIPFRRAGQTLDVAALEPEDFLIQDELRVLTGCLIRSHAVLEIRLRQALARFYGSELPVRQESLIHRLSGGGQKIADTLKRKRSTSTEKQSAEVMDSAVKEESEAVPEKPMARKKSVPSELEISDEDLKLFPSLMIEHDSEPTEGETLPTPPPLPVAEESGIPHGDDSELDLEIRLARASEYLQSAEMRDEIGDALFYFCRPYFARRMLLTLRKDVIVGWRGEGEGVDETAVRAIAIPKADPSVFLGLMQGTPFWLGPLPPMPRNKELILAMGPPEPSTCLILPIQVRGRTVAFFYGDPGEGRLPALPMAELKRLMAKADIAFQVYLFKAKIRML